MSAEAKPKPPLRRITEVPVTCPACGWEGLTGHCESGEDGELCCPRCLTPVTIHTNEFERNPWP
jgi:hypothetical protein